MKNLGPFRTRPHMPPYADPETPRVYVKSRDVTLQWLAQKHDFNTVCEYNVWEGENVADSAEVARIRCVVLMQCDHNAIMKLHSIFYDDTHPKARVDLAEVVLDAHKLGGLGAAWDVVLGYDFQRNEPSVTLYRNRA